MQLILDRFEGDLAVCELQDGSTVTLSRSLLPTDAAPGCVLIEHNGSYQVDHELTKQRKQRLLALQNKLFQK